MNIVLYGADATELRPIIDKTASLELVEENPDVVICYGGDGTLLSAEHKWPGLPKVPIRNSRLGNRMISRPPEDVIERLASGDLVPTEFIKVRCSLRLKGEDDSLILRAMNEFNVQHRRTNAAVRYKIWFDGKAFEQGEEIIGDGFVVSTPFGSTAYYRQITRGIFYVGLGVAFKFTGDIINHVVVPETAEIRAEITRGPAILAYDNWPQFVTLDTGAQLVLTKDPEPARILTWAPMIHPSDEF